MNGTSSRKKHLENFSKVFFQVFWQLALATCTRLDLVMKIACVAQKGSFSILVSKRVFISFPRIQWMFIFWSNFHSFNTTVLTHFIFNYFVFTFSIFKERFGFCLLLFIFHIYCIFLLDCVFLLIFVYLLIVYGYLIF